MTTDDLERRLRGVLRETLDGERGPDPVWADSPAARRVHELARRGDGRRVVRALAVAAVLAGVGAATLIAGSSDRTTVAPRNGWIAFTVAEPGGTTTADHDVWLVGLHQEPHRVVGSDTDEIDQLCPAFSPDGRYLAYGTVERDREAALVVGDVSAEGRVAERISLPVGRGVPPPCPVWSPDGARIAFGVPRTSPVNPSRSAEGSEVWVITVAGLGVTVLPDLLATDLEWSPDGTALAIASGMGGLEPGRALADGRIHLFAPSSGAVRSLDTTLGALSLTWAPDSRRIAYLTGESDPELRLIDLQTHRHEVLATRVNTLHGIGPVWSPDGTTIAYQRLCDRGTTREPAFCGGEGHEVVLLGIDETPNGPTSSAEVVLHRFVETDGARSNLFPFRVTWSPDSAYLLYLAWTDRSRDAPVVLAAVPVNLAKPGILLTEMDGVVAYDGYDESAAVPIQTWGRRPSD